MHNNFFIFNLTNKNEIRMVYQVALKINSDAYLSVTLAD